MVYVNADKYFPAMQISTIASATPEIQAYAALYAVYMAMCLAVCHKVHTAAAAVIT